MSNRDPWTGGEDAEWEQTGEYVVTRGPKGGHVQIGKALALRHEKAAGGPEQRANARMFAAAPEMLRALRRIVQCAAEGGALTNSAFDKALEEAAQIVARVMEGRG